MFTLEYRLRILHDRLDFAIKINEKNKKTEKCNLKLFTSF